MKIVQCILVVFILCACNKNKCHKDHKVEDSSNTYELEVPIDNTLFCEYYKWEDKKGNKLEVTYDNLNEWVYISFNNQPEVLLPLIHYSDGDVYRDDIYKLVKSNKKIKLYKYNELIFNCLVVNDEN